MSHWGLGVLVLISAVFSGCEQRDGGYSPADVKTAKVVAAANFAVTEQSKQSGTTISLVEVHSAATQPVGLTNYKMNLEVDQGGTKRKAAVVVWETVEKQQNGASIYKLSEWTWN